MKEKRNKTGNVPNLRFKGFEGEWEVKKLGDTGTFFSGGTPLTSKRHYFNGDIPFIRSGELNAKYTEQFISEEGLSNSSAKMIEVGDLIFALYGATSGEVGISKIKGAINQAILCMRTSLNNVFLLNYLRLQKETILNTYLQGGQGNLSAEIIKSITVPIPPQKEQDYIASFLSLIDERITAQSKIIQRLETLMQGLREKLFTQKLRFKDGNGCPFPDWELKKGNDVFENISNKNHNSDLPILAITQEHGAIPRELIEYQISVTDKSVENYKVVEIGNFIISLRSFQGGIEYSSYKGICSPAYIILSNKIEIESLFYKYYFKTTSYIKLLNKKLEGIRDGKMISYTYFSDISLPYPSLREQSQISNFLSTVEGKIESEKTILEQYRNQKKFLLRNLFI
jgi:type I restriction enzyme, S subunit